MRERAKDAKQYQVVNICVNYYVCTVLNSAMSYVQTGDMKHRPGNGIEGAMVCTSLGSLLRPLFYFLDDVSYPQSVQGGSTEFYSGN